MSAFILFTDRTTNGNSAAFDVLTREYSLIRVYGTWNGAKVNVFADFDSTGDYCQLQDGAWDRDDIKTIYLKPGVRLRLTLSGAGASTSLSAEVL